MKAIEYKKVTVVIVTYGDRYKFIREVLGRLLSMPLLNIIIIDNGSGKDSLRELQNFCKLYSNIRLICLSSNTGSASGFHLGIKEALKNKENEFIFLLDDDNLPELNVLKILTDYYIKNFKPGDNIALLAYRDDREIYKKAILTANPSLMLGRANSFLGFHIKNFWKRTNIKGLIDQNKSIGIVSVAPYGGLFFHKSLIQRIGLPDESFFLYGDDFDFTYRITKTNGEIILLTDAKVTDLETSFHLKKNDGYKSKSFRFLNTKSKLRIYYSIRNGILFEKTSLHPNKFKYFVNFLFFAILYTPLFVLKKNQSWKLPLFYKAIFDGFQMVKSKKSK